MTHSWKPHAGKKLAVGIDLGGTNVRIGLMAPDGSRIVSTRMPTRADEGEACVMSRIAAAVDELLHTAHVTTTDIAGVGIGCPGVVDLNTGTLTYSANLHWHDAAIGQELTHLLGVPTIVHQDAIAAALGERWLGAGQDACHLIYLAVGTGIGAGIIIGGQPYLGIHGVAGNIGHTILKEDGPLCSCGKRGCLEALASGPAVARSVQELLRHSTQVGPLATMHANGIEITSQTVVEAAKQGDTLAKEVLEESGRYLGQGIAILLNVLNPQTVIVGGGLSQAGDFLLEPARQELQQRVVEPAGTASIVTAQLGDDAGMVGAAWLVWANT